MSIASILTDRGHTVNGTGIRMFHVVIDTNFLFRAHFMHPDFQKLLLRSKEGKIKIHIPHIVLEEQRTRILAEMQDKIRRAQKAFEDALRTGSYAMFTKDLPKPHLDLWTEEDVDRRSRQVFAAFVEENKINVIKLTPEHGLRAWARYFEIAPPFNAKELDRVKRREDIPDAWILEAAMDVKNGGGNLCALCDDGRLKEALQAEGFEIFKTAQELADRVDTALAVHSIGTAPHGKTVLPAQLRGPAFAEVDIAILGFIETFDTPTKTTLFDQLEKAGVDRRIAEHEAETLVLSGVIRDSGNHFIPVDRGLSAQAAIKVQHLVLKLLDDGP